MLTTNSNQAVSGDYHLWKRLLDAKQGMYTKNNPFPVEWTSNSTHWSGEVQRVSILPVEVRVKQLKLNVVCNLRHCSQIGLYGFKQPAYQHDILLRNSLPLLAATAVIWLGLRLRKPHNELPCHRPPMHTYPTKKWLQTWVLFTYCTSHIKKTDHTYKY